MRREFLKALAWGSLSAFTALPGFLGGSQPGQGQKTKGQMACRRLGRTNLFVSEIALGGSPMPDWSLLREIVERGVNYIDSSCSYDNGNAERQIGRLARDVGRDKIIVATKFHLRGNWSEATIIRSVEGSLARLDTDSIDVLCIHGAGREDELTDERVLNAFDKLKKEGKFRFSGISCHSNHQRVVKKAVDCGHYDMVQLAYNVFDIVEPEKDVQTYEDYLGASRVRDLIALAASRDVGVVAMKVLKIGGRRQNLDKYRAGTTSLYQAMLKWALENKNISSVVTEILNREQMEEDLAAPQAPLSANERCKLFYYVAERSRDYCHMCGLCQAHCPFGIATTDILRYLAYHEGYGKKEAARSAYAKLRPDQTALGCRNCGLCEEICPYAVRVKRRIDEARTVLECQAS